MKSIRRRASVVEPLENRQLFAVSLSPNTDLGTFTGRRTYADSVSSTNLNDVRKLSLSATTTLSAAISGLTGNANLSLVKDSNANGLVDTGETLASSNATGTTSDWFTKTSLGAGTYYVLVSYAGTTTVNYSLAIAADQAGNTLSAARNIGALGVNRASYSDYVGPNDLNDYHKFTLSGTQWLRASLTGLSADANLRLIKDSNGNNIVDAGEVIATSSNTGTTSESLLKQLSAGTYFLDVTRVGDTNYSLNVLAPWTNIVFDYTYDIGKFFTNNPTAKDRLEDAAATFSVLLDQLSSITPSGTNTWSMKFKNPGTVGGHDVTLNNKTVVSNTVIVYVGARTDLATSTLGIGGSGGWSGSGSSAWITTLRTRGQAGVTATPVTDHSIWGGAMTFNANTPWNFSSSNPTTGKSDFLSVAIHELGHVFGMGTSNSWNAKVVSGKFTGTKSTAAYGSNPPVVSGHWAEGVKSTVNGVIQEAAMDPSITVGTRKRFTKLDYAGLADMGWQVPTSILPASAAVASASTSTTSSPITLTTTATPNYFSNTAIGSLWDDQQLKSL